MIYQIDYNLACYFSLFDNTVEGYISKIMLYAKLLGNAKH